MDLDQLAPPPPNPALDGQPSALHETNPTAEGTEQPAPTSNQLLPPRPAQLKAEHKDFLSSYVADFLAYVQKPGLPWGSNKRWVKTHVWPPFKEKFPRGDDDPSWPSYQSAVTKWFENANTQARKKNKANQTKNQPSQPPTTPLAQPQTPAKRAPTRLECFTRDPENRAAVNKRRQELLEKTPNANKSQRMTLWNAARIDVFEESSERDKYINQAKAEQAAAKGIGALEPPKPSEDELIRSRETLRESIKSYVSSFLGDDVGQVGDFIFCGLLAYRNAKDQLRCQSLFVNPPGYSFEGAVDFKKSYKTPFANYASSTLPIRSQREYIFIRLLDNGYPIFLQSQDIDDMTNKQIKAALKEYIEATWAIAHPADAVPWEDLASADRRFLLRQEPAIAALPCLDPQAMGIEKVAAFYKHIVDLQEAGSRPFEFLEGDSEQYPASPAESDVDDDNPFISPSRRLGDQRSCRTPPLFDQQDRTTNFSNFLPEGSLIPNSKGTPPPATPPNPPTPPPATPPNPPSNNTNGTTGNASDFPNNPIRLNNGVLNFGPDNPRNDNPGLDLPVDQAAEARRPKRRTRKPAEDPPASKRAKRPLPAAKQSAHVPSPQARPKTPPRLPGGWFYTDETTGTTFRPLAKNGTEMYVCDAKGRVVRDASGQFIPFKADQ